ncbi:MAG: CPBP family intramembrane glutamic endopeptidase [Anaerolineae bacterium]|nr:CPBP family intramembrane glutamic endopeptidase [Anaerolineae bacterium]
MSNQIAIEQHSVRQSVLLHLLPGVLIGICYFLILQPFQTWGYPSIMALMMAAVIILVPFELGFLLYQGYKKNGRLSLQGVISYCERIPVWQYFIWVPALFVLAGVIFTLMKPIDTFLQENVFAWMPAMESGLTEGFSKPALIVTYSLVAVIGAIIAPTVEELYFRGYLLPRMEYAGKWANLLHSFLFALYHVFTPWMLLTRTLAMLPLVYAVKKRSLYLSIMVHFLVNMMDVAAGAAFILAMSGV